MATIFKPGTKYYDLSNPISENMPFYPASFPVQVTQVSSSDAGKANVHKITMASHHGTHVDAPWHAIPSGMRLDEMDLNKFMGEGIVLDLSFKEVGSGIAAGDLEKFSNLVRLGDIAILYTGCSSHLSEPWINSSYTYLDLSGAEWLVRKQVKAVGIDVFSVDQYGDGSHPAHHALLGNDIPLIEEISSAAKHLLGKRIYLICLPIRMMMGDGAPARAIAYELES